MGEEVKLEGLKSELRKEARKTGLDFDELKSGGFIKQIQRDLFTVRLRCPGGMLEAEKVAKAAEIARKYGRGIVHVTIRQSIEIPYVHYENFSKVVSELKSVGWSVASCGPRVRVPTACAGCTYNPNGLMDTQKLCLEVDRRFFGMPTGHHKFKVSLSGCPIDCMRTREMDLGFQGIMEPMLDPELCNSCGLCVQVCEEKALKMEKDLPVRDIDKCIFCGDCVKICPVNAMRPKRTGWLVRVGGKHGKHPYFSYEVAQFVTDEQALVIVEKALEWTQKNCQGKERTCQAIERLGIDKFIDDVIRPLNVEVIDKPNQRKKFWAAGNFYQ